MHESRPYAAVQCLGQWDTGAASCGLVELTLEEYMRQMKRPNQLWFCPRCGETASYDDARSEELQGIAEDLDDEEVPR